MEVLIRWRCACRALVEACSECQGKGYLEQWLPLEQLSSFNQGNCIIYGRRQTPSDPPEANESMRG